MNLEQFNCYFTTNYDTLCNLSLKIVKDKEKSVDILHRSYESISKVLKKRDLDDTNIIGYISRTIKNWTRQKPTVAEQFNQKLVKCDNIFSNERIHSTENAQDAPNLYAFKRKIDEYLLLNYSLQESSLFKLKYVYSYTYDMIVAYTNINRATAHEIITTIHKDLKQKFKTY